MSGMKTAFQAEKGLPFPTNASDHALGRDHREIWPFQIERENYFGDDQGIVALFVVVNL